MCIVPGSVDTLTEAGAQKQPADKAGSRSKTTRWEKDQNIAVLLLGEPTGRAGMKTWTYCCETLFSTNIQACLHEKLKSMQCCE